MAYCTKCGNTLKTDALFCTACGNKISAQSDTNKDFSQSPAQRKAPAEKKPFIVAIVVLCLGLAGTILWFSLKKETSEKSEIINKPEVTSTDTQMQPAENNSSARSYIDKTGKLVFRSDCYVIVTGSYGYESDVRTDVKRMKSEGYMNAGYLWIPEFASLSGARFFAPFIGPFSSYAECLYYLKNTAPTGRFWYGVKVSHNPERVEIRL